MYLWAVQELNLPTYPFKLKRVGEHTQIYDDIRQKWLVCTPEEWVRQHVVKWLESRGYPKVLTAVERAVKLNGMTKRADVVVFDRQGQPFLLVECKAPEVAVNQQVLDQAVRYNMTLEVPYLLLTNGLQHYCVAVPKGGTPKMVKELPAFPVKSED